MNGAPANPMSGNWPFSSCWICRMASQHEAQFLARIEAAQAFDVGGRGERALEARTLAPDEVEGQPQRSQGDQQVREQDRRIHLDAAQRLQRDLRGQVRLTANLEQAVAFPQRPVLGHVPAGLAHEPDRGCVHRLQPAGLKEPAAHAAVTSDCASATSSSSQSGL